VVVNLHKLALLDIGSTKNGGSSQSNFAELGSTKNGGSSQSNFAELGSTKNGGSSQSNFAELAFTKNGGSSFGLINEYGLAIVIMEQSMMHAIIEPITFFDFLHMVFTS
jgi:hypothetical protein